MPPGDLEVRERQLLVDGVRVHLRETAGAGMPTVFVHGNPTHSGDWLEFMRRMDGPAVAPDLPGFGRSESPDPARFDCTMTGYGRFVERFLDEAGISEYRLVCHDWGAVALIAAQRHPRRVRRLVVINAVPLLPGFRWHRIARFAWRRPLVGELFNLASSRTAARLLSAPASGTPGPLPAEFIDSWWREWTPGTWPQMLSLYRSADPPALAAAGSRLGDLGCPALVLWGAADPYIPTRFAHAYAAALPDAVVEEVDAAGHWPWVDQPRTVDSVLEFLGR